MGLAGCHSLQGSSGKLVWRPVIFVFMVIASLAWVITFQRSWRLTGVVPKTPSFLLFVGEALIELKMRIYSFFRPVGSYKYCWCKDMKWKWIMSSLLSSFEHCTTCRNIITSSSYTIILHNFRAALKLKISAISPLNRHFSHVLL